MAKKTESPETASATAASRAVQGGTRRPRRQGAPQAAGAQLNVLGQYIKDLSFESPAAPEVLQNPPPNPQLQVTVNVNVGEQVGTKTMRWSSISRSTPRATPA